MEPECQCSSTRPVTSHKSKSWSGNSAGGSYGSRHHNGLLVGVPVELPAGALLDIRIETLAIAPARLLAVDDRPAQAAHFVVAIELGQIVPVAAAELGVFLEQSLLNVKTEVFRLEIS